MNNTSISNCNITINAVPTEGLDSLLETVGQHVDNQQCITHLLQGLTDKLIASEVTGIRVVTETVDKPNQ